MLLDQLLLFLAVSVLLKRVHAKHGFSPVQQLVPDTIMYCLYLVPKIMQENQASDYLSCLPAHEELHAYDAKDKEDPRQQQHHIQKQRNGGNQGADQQPDTWMGAEGAKGPEGSESPKTGYIGGITR